MIKKGKMKCFACERKSMFIEKYIFLEPGHIRCRSWECTRCGEAYLDSGPAQQSLLLNKLQRGLKVKIGQLGNSEIFRFPADVVKLLGLKKGGEVTARVISNKGKLVLEITPN